MKPRTTHRGRITARLLDEYWGALRGESGADLRQRLIDRDRPDESIAEDLDVLDLLHQVRRVTPRAATRRSSPTAWISESFAIGPARGRAAPGPDPLRRGGGPGGGRSAAADRQVPGGRDARQGGQAQVFRVLHPELGKEYVLKLARRPMAMEEQAGRDALLDARGGFWPSANIPTWSGSSTWMSTRAARSWSWSTSRG